MAVAQTIALPNVRKMFKPDPGYTFIDIDLAKADAQVVAWDAGAERLKQLFREKADLHTENAKDIFGVTRVTDDLYAKAKAGVHAANYIVSPRTLAVTLGCTVHEADNFLTRWFAANPEIKEWHKRIDNDIRTTRCVYNAFGFRFYYFDRIVTNKPLGSPLPQGQEMTAWIGQGTVAIANHEGLCNIDEQLPDVQLLLEVHDSLLMQAPTTLCPAIFHQIASLMEVPIPYKDPLIISTSMAVSDKNWGDVEKISVLPPIATYEKPKVVGWHDLAETG